MAELTFEQQVESMTAPSGERLASLRGAIKGVGGQALAEFNQLEDALSWMPRLGRDGADKKAQYRADTSLPYDHRTKAADETHDYHKLLIAKHSEFGAAADKRLREELERGLLPKTVGRDERALVQREIELLVGDAHGEALVTKAREALGRDPRHDAELLSSFGEALFRGRGAQDRHATLKTEAVEKWLARADGTTHQINSRKALQAYRAANTTGAVAAYRAAGQMNLTRDDR